MSFSTISIDGNGNTRPEPIAKFAVHLDYLRFRCETITPQGFENLLNFLCEDYTTEIERPWSPGAGSVYYSNKLIGTHGFVGGFDINSEGVISCMIDLPGGYWEQLNVVDSWRKLIGLANAFHVKCSRIDIAIDDPTYSRIPVSKMRESWERGNNFGFRKHKYTESGETPEKMRKTWNFGSRESGKFTRIYDHEGECLRHEVEFKRHFAREVFEKLASITRPIDAAWMQSDSLAECVNGEDNETFESIISKELASLTLGAIDFRDRGNRKDATRGGYRDSKRLSFYQEYIDEVCGQTYRLTAPKPAKSLLKTVDWVKRQVSSTLAMMNDGIGGFNFRIWLQDLLIYGRERYDKLKPLWIAEMKRSPHVVRV